MFQWHPAMIPVRSPSIVPPTARPPRPKYETEPTSLMLEPKVSTYSFCRFPWLPGAEIVTEGMFRGVPKTLIVMSLASELNEMEMFPPLSVTASPNTGPLISIVGLKQSSRKVLVFEHQVTAADAPAALASRAAMLKIRLQRIAFSIH